MARLSSKTPAATMPAAAFLAVVALAVFAPSSVEAARTCTQTLEHVWGNLYRAPDWTDGWPLAGVSGYDNCVQYCLDTPDCVFMDAYFGSSGSCYPFYATTGPNGDRVEWEFDDWNCNGGSCDTYICQGDDSEECGNPIATVKYLPNGANGQGEYITTDCQPAKWDCSSPDYVLDGTSYWSLGDSEANDDKRSCADGPVDD